jgi:uncharacterized repeat protein (TIGR01451 family)
MHQIQTWHHVARRALLVGLATALVTIVSAPGVSAAPGISVVKEQRLSTSATFTTAPITAKPGDEIDYKITVTNTGDVDLRPVTASDANCSGMSPGSIISIPRGGTGVFFCEHNVVAADCSSVTNVATVTGTQPTGPAVTATSNQVVANINQTCAPPTPQPGISIQKLERIGGSGSFVGGPISGKVGDTVQYQITVTNTGDIVLNNVTLTDPNCSSISPTTIPSIAPGATGVPPFTCSHTLTAADGSSYTNTATATGTPPGGSPITSPPSSVVVNIPPVTTTTTTTVTTTTTTTPPSTPSSTPSSSPTTTTTTTTPTLTTPPAATASVPGIAIIKSQRVGSSGTYTRSQITVKVGDTIEYRIIVSNTGNTSLTVTLTDPHCDSIAPAGNQSIAAGAAKAYTCSHLVIASDPETYTNTATARGTTPGGATVGPVSATVVAKSAAVLGAKKVHKVKKVAKKHVVKKPVVKKPVVKPVKKVATKPKPVVKPAQFTG